MSLQSKYSEDPAWIGTRTYEFDGQWITEVRNDRTNTVSRPATKDEIAFAKANPAPIADGTEPGTIVQDGIEYELLRIDQGTQVRGNPVGATPIEQVEPAEVTAKRKAGKGKVDERDLPPARGGNF